MVTEVHAREQLVQDCTRKRGGRESNPRPTDRKSNPTSTPPSHTLGSSVKNLDLLEGNSI